MSDTITLYEKCEHGWLAEHWPFMGETGTERRYCPGAKEVALQRTSAQAVWDYYEYADDKNDFDGDIVAVWVEVSDE